jgi:V/A-type H+-transporting ATPase subunit D
MAKKYKLNKSELTRMKREVRIYNQFLPVLKLKQEQLQIEHLKVKREYNHLNSLFGDIKKRNEGLISVLSDERARYVFSYCKVFSVILGFKSVAGVSVPKLDGVKFTSTPLYYFAFPAWFTKNINLLRKFVEMNLNISVVLKQIFLIKKELKKSTQQVNLFEKVLIPESEYAIKRIKIALADEQVAAVGRGKIAKKKQAINV